MSESRNDGKADLTKMRCLNKVVLDKHLKQFNAKAVWTWLDEASEPGGIFSFKCKKVKFGKMAVFLQRRDYILDGRDRTQKTS